MLRIKLKEKVEEKGPFDDEVQRNVMQIEYTELCILKSGDQLSGVDIGITNGGCLCQVYDFLYK